jgi:glycosyltransferase involved in cell wall biosynthesis
MTDGGAPRPKILVVTTTFPRWAGDAVPAPFVYDLCRHLADDFALTVLAPHDPGAALAETLDGLRVWRFPYFWPETREFLANGVGLLPNLRSSALGKAQAATLVAAQQRRLRRVLACERFDAIHSHWLVPSALNVALAERRRAPHIVTIHSSDLHLLRQLPGGAAITRFILRRTRAVFAVSTFLRRMLADLVGFEPPAQTLPMGFDPSSFAPDRHVAPPPELAGRQGILYAGKLIEVKGVEYLLRAFARVKRELPDLTLALVGDGDRRALLEAEAAALGLGDAAVFFGARPHAQMNAFYQWAEAVVVPSIVTPRGETEGTPVVMLEALAAGRPVIGTQIGSLHELIADGENGWLVRPQDPAALAAALLETLRRPPDPARAAAASASVRDYAWPNIAAAYAAAYREVSKIRD